MSSTKVPMTYNTIWTYNKFHQSYNSHEPQAPFTKRLKLQNKL